MQLLYLLNLHIARYWNQVGTYQILKLVQYIIGIRIETKQRINAVHYSSVEVFIYLFISDLYLIKALFVSLKDRTCLRIAIPAYCLNIFGSIFGVLFSLLIKKLKVTVLLHFRIPLFSLMIWCRISCRLRII